MIRVREAAQARAGDRLVIQEVPAPGKKQAPDQEAYVREVTRLYDRLSITYKATGNTVQIVVNPASQKDRRVYLMEPVALRKLRSKSSQQFYLLKTYDDGQLTCSCPGFRFSFPPKCKHTAKVSSS